MPNGRSARELMPKVLDYGRPPKRRSYAGVASYILAIVPWVLIFLLMILPVRPPAPVLLLLLAPPPGLYLEIRGLILNRKEDREFALFGVFLCILSIVAMLCLLDHVIRA
jgi:hypothetical protein